MYTQCFLLGIGCDHAQRVKEVAEFLFTSNSIPSATEPECEALANHLLESFDLAPKGLTKFVTDAFGPAFREDLARQGLVPEDRVISRSFEPPVDWDMRLGFNSDTGDARVRPNADGLRTIENVDYDIDDLDEDEDEITVELARHPEGSPNRPPLDPNRHQQAEAEKVQEVHQNVTHSPTAAELQERSRMGTPGTNIPRRKTAEERRREQL